MKHIAISLAVLVMAVSAGAATLSPSRALAAALGDTPAALKGHDTGRYSLAHTFATREGEPAIYVFGRTDGAGFIVTSASDLCVPLLGYAEAGAFDAANIPSNVEWWLGTYTAAIAAAEASGCLCAAPPVMESHFFIENLCSTTWNQDYPYNLECPQVGGSRAVTGCVATAMAQVMKAHNWPDVGTGEHTYAFQAYGSTYEEGMVFSDVTFDWANMLDSYGWGQNNTQRTAVARLMHACGVASDMMYSPEGSGAYVVNAGHGMMEWLKYDRGMRSDNRTWYTAEEWSDLIFNDLASGRPVIISGDDTTVGHAFVCDGYNNNEYFHINWGWGGYCDGYFLLSDLNPSGSGIGGGSSGMGYNNGVNVICNIKPAEEGSKPVPALGLSGRLTSSEDTYSRNSDERFRIMNYITSYSFETFDYNMGVIAVDAEGNETFVAGATTFPLEPYTTFWEGSIDVAVDDLPSGSYDLYPAYSTPETGPGYVNVDVSDSPRYLHIIADGDNVMVTEGSIETDITAVLAEIRNANTGSRAIYAGETYNFTFSIAANEGWTGEVECVLLDDTETQVVATSEPMQLNFDTSGIKKSTWTLTIPEELPVGTYCVSLSEVTDGGTSLIPAGKMIEVAEMPLTIDCNLLRVNEDREMGTLYIGETCSFLFELTATRDWSGDVHACLLKKQSVRYTAVASGEWVATTLEKREPQEVYATLEIPADTKEGNYYVGLYYDRDNNHKGVLAGNPVPFTLKQPSGIETVTSQQPSYRYFTVEGIETSRPTHGFYIRVDSDGKARKIKL